MDEEYYKCFEWYSNIQSVYKEHIAGIGVLKADMNVFAPQGHKISLDLVFSIDDLSKVTSMYLGNFNYFKAQEELEYVVYTCTQKDGFPKIVVFPNYEYEFNTIVAWTEGKNFEKCVYVGQVIRDLIVDGLKQSEKK